jgi:hypothetical protein
MQFQLPELDDLETSGWRNSVNYVACDFEKLRHGVSREGDGNYAQEGSKRAEGVCKKQTSWEFYLHFSAKSAIAIGRFEAKMNPESQRDRDQICHRQADEQLQSLSCATMRQSSVRCFRSVFWHIERNIKAFLPVGYGVVRAKQNIT